LKKEKVGKENIERKEKKKRKTRKA